MKFKKEPIPGTTDVRFTLDMSENELKLGYRAAGPAAAVAAMVAVGPEASIGDQLTVLCIVVGALEDNFEAETTRSEKPIAASHLN